MRITELRSQSEGMLYIIADDGRVGIFDVRPYFEYDVFKVLQNPDEFMKVSNGDILSSGIVVQIYLLIRLKHTGRLETHLNSLDNLAMFLRSCFNCCNQILNVKQITDFYGWNIYITR